MTTAIHRRRQVIGLFTLAGAIGGFGWSLLQPQIWESRAWLWSPTEDVNQILAWELNRAVWSHVLHGTPMPPVTY
ncbi:MAG: hypothetical protein U1G08_01630 [Verrucomicrobiota bacterium]